LTGAGDRFITATGRLVTKSLSWRAFAVIKHPASFQLKSNSATQNVKLLSHLFHPGE
jgi:hypothetical protein